jgi:L-lactate dehydrogenase complex protein LldE
MHSSCGTLRRLKCAAPSELHEPFFSEPMDLLSKIEGIKFAIPARQDECCGFGGPFSVSEESVSTDSSCLMHQQGGAERIGAPIKFIHIAQILNGASA